MTITIEQYLLSTPTKNKESIEKREFLIDFHLSIDFNLNISLMNTFYYSLATTNNQLSKLEAQLVKDEYSLSLSKFNYYFHEESNMHKEDLNLIEAKEIRNEIENAIFDMEIKTKFDNNDSSIVNDVKRLFDESQVNERNLLDIVYMRNLKEMIDEKILKIRIEKKNVELTTIN